MEPWKIKAAAAALKLCVNQFGSQDPMKILEKCKIGEVSLPPEEAPATGSYPPPMVTGTQLPVGGSTVSDAETLLYQLQSIKDDLIPIEKHLSEGCLIKTFGGQMIRCDCCQGKHAPRLKVFARETVPIANRSGNSNVIYDEIAAWAEMLEQLPRNVSADVLKKESGPAGAFRKRIDAMIQELK